MFVSGMTSLLINSNKLELILSPFFSSNAHNELIFTLYYNILIVAL